MKDSIIDTEHTDQSTKGRLVRPTVALALTAAATTAVAFAGLDHAILGRLATNHNEVAAGDE